MNLPKLLCSAWVLLTFSQVAAQPDFRQVKESFDVLHYRFEIALNDSTNRVQVNASVTLLYLQTEDTTVLDLATIDGDGLGMRVSSLMMDEREIAYVHAQESLRILTPSIVGVGDTVTYLIRYSGIPKNGLVIAKNKYGQRTFFGEHWPNRAHQWLPVIDHPSEKATSEFIVTAPVKYQVVSNGDQISRKVLEDGTACTHWRMNQPIATKVMVIGVAEFVSTQLESDIPTSVWLYQQPDSSLVNDFAQAPEVYSFVQDLYGDYPYSKLDHVMSTTRFGGMENAGCIFYDENQITGAKKVNGLIAHEVGHQWFGNSVTEVDWEDIWLSEGFATFIESQYIAHQYGRDSMMALYVEDEERIFQYNEENPTATVVQTNIEDLALLLNRLTYQKAGWMLKMLQAKLGDEVFSQVVLKFYRTYQHKNASTQNFIDIAKKVSGQDLDEFFHQWLYVSGQPEVSSSWRYKKGKLELKLTQHTSHVYALDITIGIQQPGMNFFVESVFLDQKEQTFYLEMDEPVSIELDPLNVILGDIK